MLKCQIIYLILKSWKCLSKQFAYVHMQKFFKVEAPSQISFWSWMLIGFFNIAVTDVCIKLFEKGDEGVF